MKNKIKSFLLLPFFALPLALFNLNGLSMAKADSWEFYHLPIGSETADTSYDDPMYFAVDDSNRDAVYSTVIGNSKIGETYDPATCVFNATPSIIKTNNGRLIAASMRGDNNEPNDNNYCALALSDDDGDTWIDPVFIIDNNVVTTRIGDVYCWLSSENVLFVFLRIVDNSIITMDTGNQRGNIYSDHATLMLIDNPDAPVSEWHIEYRRTAFEESGYVNASAGRNMGIFYEDEHEIYYLITQTAAMGAASLQGRFYVSEDKGQHWYLRSFIDFASKDSLTFLEFSVAQLSDGTLWMTHRIEGGSHGGVGRFISHDFGKTWTEYSNGLGRPFVGPGSYSLLSNLHNGNIIFVTNYSTVNRNNLRVFLSEDDGKTWPYEMNLDYRRASTYPVVFQNYFDPEVFYISWDNGRGGQREMRYAKLTAADIKAGQVVTDGCYSNKLLGYGKNHNYFEISSIDEQFEHVIRLKKDSVTRNELKSYLPSTINGTLDNCNKVSLSGEWNLSEVMLGKNGIYYSTFDCAMPSNTLDGRNLLIVQINVGDTGNVVKSVAETFERNLSVSYGTDFETVIKILPTVVHIIDQQGRSYELNGSWICENYKANRAGKYKIIFQAHNAPFGLDDRDKLLEVVAVVQPSDNPVDPNVLPVIVTKNNKQESMILTLTIVSIALGVSAVGITIFVIIRRKKARK